VATDEQLGGCDVNVPSSESCDPSELLLEGVGMIATGIPSGALIGRGCVGVLVQAVAHLGDEYLRIG
jgi:hypothetical protein